jgi:phage terminase small subunit
MPRTKAQERDKHGCTPQETLFCYEYIAKKFNGTQAAIAAGYSKKSAGELASRMLRKVNIQAKIKDLTQQLLKKERVSAADVINELALLGLADVSKIAEFDGQKVQFKSFKDMGKQSRTIQYIEATSTPAGRDKKGNAIIEQKVRLKFHDKKGSLELLGRHMELFTEKVDLTSGGEIIRPKIVIPDNGRNPQHIARRSGSR